MIVQLVVATGNRAGQIIPVLAEKFLIGRAEDCHLKPRSELVSRYHCAILVGNDVVVRDLGSKNGVRLNDEKINAEQKLKNGDKLVVGPLEFYIHITIDSEPMTELPKELPVGNLVEVDANCFRRTGDHADREELFSSVLLLDHLKALNQETTPESNQSEQPAANLLKKLL